MCIGGSGGVVVVVRGERGGVREGYNIVYRIRPFIGVVRRFHEKLCVKQGVKRTQVMS